MSSELFDPSHRRLCPDPSCLGVLDPEGRCPICGRVGEPASDLGGTPTASPEEVFAAEEPLELPAAPSGEDEGFASGRHLCPDGGCLGVLGPDGRCNVCGRSAS